MRDSHISLSTLSNFLCPRVESLSYLLLISHVLFDRMYRQLHVLKHMQLIHKPRGFMRNVSFSRFFFKFKVFFIYFFSAYGIAI